MSSAFSPAFDPYEQWLGIRRDQQPADHYRLLGLAKFESDPERIEAAADERMDLVRQHQAGPRGALTQPLLNELAAARNCLMAPEAKAAYDEQLRRQGTAAPLARVVSPPAGARLPVAPVPVPVSRIPEPPVSVQALPYEQAPAAHSVESAESDAQESDAVSFTSLAIRFLGMAAAVMLIAGVTFGIGRVLWRRDPKDHTELPVTKRAEPEANPGEVNPNDDSRIESSTGRKSLPRNAVVVLQEGSREIHLTPVTAILTGNVKLKPTGGDELLDQWSRQGDAATWLFKLLRPGFFQLEVTYASLDEAGEIRIAAILDDIEAKTFTLRPTGALDKPSSQRHTLTLSSSGQHALAIRLQDDVEPGSFQLREVRLVPTGTELGGRK